MQSVKKFFKYILERIFEWLKDRHDDFVQDFNNNGGV